MHDKKILLIDVGNSLIKVGIWHKGELLKNKLCTLETLYSELSSYEKLNVSEILFTSVISETKTNKIYSILTKKFNVEITQIKSKRSFLGVKNGYKQPAKLGDDRWCSIVGGHYLYKKSFIIVDCGTAISLDCVGEDAVHKGGYIFSGFEGYWQSFTNAYGLKDLRIKKQKVKSLSPAKSTSDALIKGYILMISSVIEKIYANFSSESRDKPKLIITGSYGAEVSKSLNIKSIFEPNLVLKSLGVIFEKKSKL